MHKVGWAIAGGGGGGGGVCLTSMQIDCFITGAGGIQMGGGSLRRVSLARISLRGRIGIGLGEGGRHCSLIILG